MGGWGAVLTQPGPQRDLETRPSCSEILGLLQSQVKCPPKSLMCKMESKDSLA